MEASYIAYKNYVYQDNLNLFARKRIAEFEENLDNIVEKLKTLEKMIAIDDETYEEWLKKEIAKINYRIIIKKISTPNNFGSDADDDGGIFISNARESKKYNLDKVNYFIDMGIPLHVIATFWSLTVGPILEKKMKKCSFGNRLKNINPYSRSTSSNEVFMRYFNQYEKWRDGAINAAQEVLEDNDKVTLISLDVKEFFYNVEIDYDEIIETINLTDELDDCGKKIARRLTKTIQSIGKKYRDIIAENLYYSHPDAVGKTGLPIGLISSPILANWYLCKFDEIILEQLRPVYYGRYVDDLLLVFRDYRYITQDCKNIVPKSIKHFCAPLFEDDEHEKGYKVKDYPLLVQEDKIILQHYDPSYSKAGLTKFKKDLEERSSAFRFLPAQDELDRELDNVAYDILYEGSPNKFRSFIGLKENETELSQYLSRQISAHRLCQVNDNYSVISQLRHFFRGINSIRFPRLWEKVYEYCAIIGKMSHADNMYKNLQEEFCKIESGDISSVDLIDKLKKDLTCYNDIALAMSASLLDLRKISDEMDDIERLAKKLRNSNMMRHHFVAWPLVNFTDFLGDISSNKQVTEHIYFGDLNPIKLRYSPRFIHFDEWQLFDLYSIVNVGESLDSWLTKTWERYKGWRRELPKPDDTRFPDDKPFQQISFDDRGINKSQLKIGGTSSPSRSFRIAVANIRVDSTSINAALRQDISPDISLDREQHLYDMLNAAVRERADMLVMPEVSLPVSWLPSLVSFSRQHQIAIIFGLEHWVGNGLAYNLLFELLPGISKDGYKTCVVAARVKNHYAPQELELIANVGLKPATDLVQVQNYQRTVWRGVSFASYNCFELSDMGHRVLFKSEIDLLVACVWNRDTNYYDHILESAVRDLHCYVVQVNTSQYGGSCVMRPASTERKRMMYVKGGENAVILTTNIDVFSLREFQHTSQAGGGSLFKKLPPGFSHDVVLKRSTLIDYENGIS